jgi:tetratricopeptide (TPR) repeat protein
MPEYGAEVSRKISGDATRRVAERCAAVYLRLVELRHLERWPEFADLVRANRHFKDSQPAWFAMEAEAAYRTATSSADLRDALRIARQASKRFQGVGLKLLTAEIILDLVGYQLSPDPALVTEAESCLNDALGVDPESPRFLVTLARLNAVTGDHEGALQLMQRAIAREPTDSLTYAVRLSEYHANRGEIRSRRLLVLFNDESKKAIEEFRSSRDRLIETMALLLAAVTLIMTAVQISARFTPRDASGLLCFAGAVIIVVFRCFASLNGKGRAPLSLLPAYASALFLAVGGLWLLGIFGL